MSNACKHDGAWLHDASYDSWACQLCGFSGSYADRSHARREAMVKEQLEKSLYGDSEGRLVVGRSAATAYEQGQKLSDYIKGGPTEDTDKPDLPRSSGSVTFPPSIAKDGPSRERPKVAGSSYQFENIALEDWLKRLPDGALLNVIKVGAATALRDPAGDQLYVLG